MFCNTKYLCIFTSVLYLTKAERLRYRNATLNIMDTQKVFLEMHTDILIETPFGAIVSGKFEKIKKGWVAKLKGATDFEGEDGKTTAMEIASQTTNKIAGYKADEIELWDVVEVFESEAEATEFGKAMGQMTIYQIETQKLKWIS